jgi:type VI secretion system protein
MALSRAVESRPPGGHPMNRRRRGGHPPVLDGGQVTRMILKSRWSIRLRQVLSGTAWLVAGILVGCGGGPTHLRVTLEAEQGANEDSPIPVTVLVIYQETAFSDLSRLTASEWFEQAEQRKRDNPEGASFDIITREILPGQRIDEQVIELTGEDAQGLVYAGYNTPGSHRARFNPRKRILVVLGVDDVTVVDLADQED